MISYNADISQRLQLETNNKGVRPSVPLQLATGPAQPVWSPSDRYKRSAILLRTNTAAGSIFTAEFTRDELLQLWQGNGNGIADVVAQNPPRVWPRMVWLDYMFFTKTANPSGGTQWRSEVYVAISQDGASIYTIPLLNEVQTGLTGGVTDFWIREPKKPVPIPMPGNTDFFRGVSIIDSLNTDTYGIASLFVRIQTSDPTTNIANLGVVLTADF